MPAHRKFLESIGFKKFSNYGWRVLNSHLEWVDYSEYLPVNSAVVYSAPETEKKPYTVAQAMKYDEQWSQKTRKQCRCGKASTRTLYINYPEVVNTAGPPHHPLPHILPLLPHLDRRKSHHHHQHHYQ